jgi:hypothetical protein
MFSVSPLFLTAGSWFPGSVLVSAPENQRSDEVGSASMRQEPPCDQIATTAGLFLEGQQEERRC